MRVEKCDMPQDSLARAFLPADYSDVYKCRAVLPQGAGPDDIMVGFWTDFPGWVAALFRLRNFLVRLVGLKGPDQGKIQELERCIRTGGSYGLASVAAKNGEQTLLRLSDRHLDALMGVHIAGQGDVKEVYAVTLVHYHNRLGRVYFFFVRPFHGLVVKAMLRRAAGKK